MTRNSNTTQGTSDWLKGAVKSHPEGLLLLAAGCALLLRSGASGSGQSSGRRSESKAGGRYPENYGRRQTGTGVSESISQVADGAREYAADVTKTVSDKVGTYASAVGEYADDAWRQSERFAGEARNTMQDTLSRVVQEQPLALAVAGLAAGAALAAVFPSTAVERRALGQAGERLTEAASSAGQQLSQAASRAGEKLMDAAEQRGLSADGLKEVASDVAGAFTGAFGSEQNNRSGQSSKTNQGSSLGTQPGSTQPKSGSSTPYGQPASGGQQSGSTSGQSGGPSTPGTTKQS